MLKDDEIISAVSKALIGWKGNDPDEAQLVRHRAVAREAERIERDRISKLIEEKSYLARACPSDNNWIDCMGLPQNFLESLKDAGKEADGK